MAHTKPKCANWSPGKRSRAVTLREEGYTYEDIAKRLGGGATKSGVRKVCQRYKETRTTKTAPKSGRKPKVTPQDERRICRLALQDRRQTSKDINKVLNGLRARIPRKKPYLNIKQRQKRLDWAATHKEWTSEDWGKVIWSDETKISIFGSDGIRFVRRRQGEDMLPECTTATMKHPVSVMVWGCMTRDGVGRLEVVEGTITAKRYQDLILEPKLLPSIDDLFEGDRGRCIFQQDGAPCHTAKTSMKWLQDHHINVLPWPGNSPDLNPIENLWSRLKILVSRRNPGNKRELIGAIIQAWFHVITPEDLRRLVDSMPRRIEQVIKLKGFPTKY